MTPNTAHKISLASSGALNVAACKHLRPMNSSTTSEKESRLHPRRMTSKTKKAVSGGGKSKKGQGFGKERVQGGGGLASPLATFEDDDMYQEPIKKVSTRFDAYQQNDQG